MEVRASTYEFGGDLIQPKARIREVPAPGNVLASLGCCNKILQTGGLVTTEMYSLTVLEARRLKSRCREACVLSEGSRG